MFLTISFLQVEKYIDGAGTDTALLLLGGPGTGKSSVMSRAVDDTLTRVRNKAIPG